MRRMTTDEARQFIRDHRSPAIAAVTRPDGRPHASPIWIVPDGDDIRFSTDESSVKAKAFEHNPYVTLVVQDDRPPFHFVKIEGRVVEFEEDLETLKEWAGRLGARYMGEERAGEFAERNAVPGEVLARMEVDSITGYWSITD